MHAYRDDTSNFVAEVNVISVMRYQVESKHLLQNGHLPKVFSLCHSDLNIFCVTMCVKAILLFATSKFAKKCYCFVMVVSPHYLKHGCWTRLRTC